ncbi:MAG: hypothetical protein B7Y99_09585 [Caulobacterales bacterium 32-69-10]|nr:MAG: hypothetical protein B7Y99_09585 [Caulobacterales bacterium 32-69-10]
MAKRKITPGVWISAVFGVAIVVGAGMVFSGALRSTAAPDDRGICFRMIGGEENPRYVELAKNVANLETCAAHLERLFLQAGGTVAGAYQGRFIFVDSKAIRSATSLEGSRWQIFFGPQRAALDKRLMEGTNVPTTFTMPAR